MCKSVTKTRDCNRKVQLSDLHTTHYYEFISQVAYNTRVRILLNIHPLILESFLHSIQHGRSCCKY